MSNSLLNNKYLNKLDVNRLQVNQLKANEVLPKIDSETKSYLFSAILNNVKFKKIENKNHNAKLIINLSVQTQEVIQFTDRPFTQSNKITIQQFVQLFLLREPDSFKEIPPNVVLSFNNTQKSYTMSLANFFAKENKVVFNLKLLTGEEHTQDNFTGTINMFVDDDLNNISNLTVGGTITFSGAINTAIIFESYVRTFDYQGGSVYQLYSNQGANFSLLLIGGSNVPTIYLKSTGDVYVSTNITVDNGNLTAKNLTLASLPTNFPPFNDSD